MISIIVPTCDRHDFLRMALNSLLDQGVAMEVLVVNAGTGPLPDTILPRDLPARVLPWAGHRVNQSTAINQGLRAARGDRVTIVQDDDAVLPGGFRAMSDALDAHPEAGVVYSLPQYTDARGAPTETSPRLRSYLMRHPVITWATVLAHGLFIHGTATMYRRASLDRIGGWDETLGTAEEYDAHLRMLHAGIVFQGVDAVTVTYRKHPGGKSYDRKRRRAMRVGVMARIYARLGLTPVAAEAPPG